MNYKSLNKIIIRTPYYSTKVLDKLWDSPLIRNQIWQSDFFKHAILNTSKELYDRLDLYLKGKLSIKDTKNIERTLIKYSDRMASRCTPFGLFSCCSIANLTEDNLIQISTQPVQFTRLDMDLMYRIFNQLEQSDLLSSFHYKLNSEIYSVGKDYRYIISSYKNSNLEFQIVKTAKSNLLTAIINFMNEPKYLHEIIDFIHSNYEIDTNDAKSYIRQLINTKLIYSEISPIIIGEDYLSKLYNYLKDNSSWKSSFENIRTNLESIRLSSNFNDTLLATTNLKNSLAEQNIPENHKYLYQIDSFREIKRGGFPKKIHTQLLDCLSILDKLCQAPYSSYLELFKRKFLEKYGEQEVSLLIALDPEVGIPYGVTVHSPNEIINNLNLPPKNHYKLNLHDSPLFRILIRKLAQNYSDEIEIQEQDLGKITDPKDNLPDSMFAMFSVFRDKDPDNFILSDLMFVAGAANLIARFSCGDESICDLVNEISDIEQKNSNTILAEIIHLPNPRTGNVLYRNMTRDYNIPCSTNDITEEKHQIKINDLYISIRNNRIFLRSKRLNKEIIPKLTTAHNYLNNPISIYRFLCDIQYQNQKSVLKFNWCNLDKILEYLPRVRYKNVILSRGRWNIAKSELMSPQDKFDYNAFCNLRNRLKINRFVYLVDGDNKLYLDLDNQTYLDILIAEIKHKEKFIFEEFYPASNFIIDADGNNYMNECIIPLIKQK